MEFKKLKAQLRKQVLEETAALSEDYILSSNKGLFENVTSLDEFIAARCIMIYYSISREPDTLEIINAALAADKTVALPRCVGNGIMHARAISCLDELQPAALGIPAPPDCAPIIVPEEFDLIIVPAVAFDKSGYRLGYGGGYYDRYLGNLPAARETGDGSLSHQARANLMRQRTVPCLTPCLTVGMAREKLLKDTLPVDSHDIAVKCVITEERVRVLK